MPERAGLYSLIEQIYGIDDAAWALLTLSDDALYHCFSQPQIEEIVKESIICGENEASRLLAAYPVLDPEEMLSELGLSVRTIDVPFSEKSKIVFFGQYTKNGIVIPGGTVKEIERQIEAADLMELLGTINVRQFLISHELFHFCEEQNKELTTATMKVRVKTLNLFYQNITPLCASEIAAFAFAKKLTNSNFHPRILEVIGVYGVSPDLSRSIVQRLLAFAPI